jgi:hypothetical protein
MDQKAAVLRHYKVVTTAMLKKQDSFIYGAMYSD